jgi:cell fate (sporulation/competence/biofilm development) regulator YlbF (YheA/YmcA/DUF963 family)
MTAATRAHDGVAFRATEALAEAIRCSPEWEEWEGARAAARADASFQLLTTQHHAVLDQARREERKGVRAGAQDDLARVRQRLFEHPAAVRRQEAVRDAVSLLRSVNRTLSEALGLEFAELAAPPRSGGCCGG